jgi:hypothetical protein
MDESANRRLPRYPFGAGATENVVDYYFKYTTTNDAACAKKGINSGTGNSGDIATFCA